jgi:hypothetical protein
VGKEKNSASSNVQSSIGTTSTFQFPHRMVPGRAYHQIQTHYCEMIMPDITETVPVIVP